MNNSPCSASTAAMITSLLSTFLEVYLCWKLDGGGPGGPTGLGLEGSKGLNPGGSTGPGSSGCVLFFSFSLELSLQTYEIWDTLIYRAHNISFKKKITEFFTFMFGLWLRVIIIWVFFPSVSCPVRVLPSCLKFIFMSYR